MPYNGSGSFSLSDTLANSTPGDADEVMGIFNDIATGLTNTVAKDGQSTMTGPLKVSNGTAAAPAIAPGSDTDTGIYRYGANQLGIAANGSAVGYFASTGWVGAVVGNVTGNVTGNLTGNVTGNVTGDVTGTASGNVPTSRTISTTSPLSGGGALSGNLTLTLADSGVSAATYKAATVTVDAKGRITAASSTIPCSGQAGLVTASAASPTVTFKSSSITSITRTGTGTWDVVLSGFSNAQYTVHVTGGNSSASVLVTPTITAKSSSGFTIGWTYTNTSGAVDPGASIIVDISIFGGI